MTFHRKDCDSLRKQIRKNSFIEGTFAAYFAIVLTKILGALYSIPFYGIIGDGGGVIYACSYNIYVIFLSIATSGIPSAIAIVISEYNAKEMYGTNERVYRLSRRLVATIAIISFILLEVFANVFAKFLMGDISQGVPVTDIAAGIRAIAVCLLIVPFLSIRRGYLQGYKFISVSSNSQIVEQVVRIAVVLAGSFITITVFHLPVVIGVCLALLGAAIGAAASMLYLFLRTRGSGEIIHPYPDPNEVIASDREIIRKVFGYCVTIVLVSVATSIYEMVDMKLLLVGLHKLAFADDVTQIIASIQATWIPRIGVIITSISMGITTSIVPHMAESHVLGENDKIIGKINQAIGTIFLIAIPLCTGIIVCAEPVYRLFYGYAEYGPSLLQLHVVVCVLASMTLTLEMILQGLGLGKWVCFCVIFGSVVNAALDLPFIFFLNRIGIAPYLGASSASIVGQGITIVLLLHPIIKQYGFSYKPMLITFVKVIIPALIMSVVVYGVQRVLPIADGRGILFLIELMLYGIVGVIVYGLITLKAGVIASVIGQDSMDGLMRRLRIKK